MEAVRSLKSEQHTAVLRKLQNVLIHSKPKSAREWVEKGRREVVARAAGSQAGKEFLSQPGREAVRSLLMEMRII